MTNSNISDSLSELAVKITLQVAEMLSTASKGMPPDKRNQVDQMIQEQLPDVVLNSLFKTQALHSAKGVEHLKENLDYYSTQIAQRFIKNDM
jgi:hydroxypyruvate isomerase